MPERHATEEELILHYYGEPLDPSTGSGALRATSRGDRRRFAADGPPEQAQLDAHIDACPRCCAALQELSQLLSLVDAQALPAPLDGLEQRVWARIESEARERQSSWWSRVFTGMPRWALAGGIAGLVLTAFVAGRFTQPGGSIPERPEVAAVEPSVSVERVMDVAVGDHLDQSQMVLLELLNSDGTASSLAAEQERARDLVAANRLFRHTALQSGNEGVRDVLDALERVLIEIANAPPDVSARELEALRADIEQRGIVFRLRVVASEMRAREQNVMGPSPTGL